MIMVQNKKSFWLDMILLIVANLITLLFYLHGNGSIEQIIIIYYFQTVIISILYYKKIYVSHYLSEMIGKKKIDAKTKKAIKYRTINEQFVYLVIIIIPVSIAGVFLAGWLFERKDEIVLNWIQLLTASTIFLTHHYYSYRHFISLIPKQKKRWNGYSVVPYKKLFIRISTTIMFGIFAYGFDTDTSVIVFFVFIKTIVDIVLSSTARVLRNS